MAEALIALGGNIGDARSSISRAITAFCDGEVVRLLLRSSDYRTPPWGILDQPAFVNACLLVATELTPSDLLARAHDIERGFGRNREHEQRNGPRVVDIDLLSYDDVEIDDGHLTLPHPRLTERAFVLVPLAEIVPDRIVAGERVRDWLATLDQTGIEKLPPQN
jgi:2-amino-4-hydroxy-6-hydroxymethyldihydropteridine diphosphokinase